MLRVENLDATFAHAHRDPIVHGAHFVLRAEMPHRTVRRFDHQRGGLRIGLNSRVGVDVRRAPVENDVVRILEPYEGSGVDAQRDAMTQVERRAASCVGSQHCPARER